MYLTTLRNDNQDAKMLYTFLIFGKNFRVESNKRTILTITIIFNVNVKAID